jgi:hypothetical protein
MFRAILIIILLLGLLLAGCTSLTSLSGDVTAETTETQGVDVVGVPTLTVNHFAGTIRVRAGEEGHITANLTKQSRLPDQAEAEAQLDNVVMAFTQNGTDVTLNIEGPDTMVESINTPSADLELLIPPGTTLDLNLGAGDITLEEPDGDVAVNLGAGDTTTILPADAAFRLAVSGGAVTIDSEFEGVPGGGVATDIDTTVGVNPTQTLTFNLGAGDIRLEQSNR